MEGKARRREAKSCPSPSHSRWDPEPLREGIPTLRSPSQQPQQLPAATDPPLSTPVAATSESATTSTEHPNIHDKENTANAPSVSEVSFSEVIRNVKADADAAVAAFRDREASPVQPPARVAGQPVV